MCALDEGEFQTQVENVIKYAMGGDSSRIESRRYPGNSDLLVSLDRMCVVELKATKDFAMHRKIHLKHPLDANQRRFLRKHGEKSDAAFVFILLSRNDKTKNMAILFDWMAIPVMDGKKLQDAIPLAQWYGHWPMAADEAQKLKSVLNGHYDRST